MGLIKDKSSLGICEKLAVSALCRRRLPIILKNLKFVETLKEGVTFIEQGRF
jgi:U3 small nucleolar ribonucleoprotein protein IMP3